MAADQSVRQSKMNDAKDFLKEEGFSIERLSGYALFCTWTVAAFSSTIPYGGITDSRPELYASLIISLIVFIGTVASVLPKKSRLDELILRKRTIIVLAALIVCGTLAMPFCSTDTPFGQVMLLASGILTGVASPLMLLGWMRIFSDVGSRLAMVEMSAAFLVAGTADYFLSYCPQAIAVATLALATVGSAILLRSCAWHRCRKETPDASHRTTPEIRRFFKKGCVAIFLLTFVYASVDAICGYRFFTVGENYAQAVLCSYIVAALAICLFALLSKNRAFLFAYRFFALMLAMSTISIPLMTDNATYASMFALAGYVSISILVPIAANDISNYFGIRSTKVVAFVYLVMYAGELCGALVMLTLPALGISREDVNWISFMFSAIVLMAAFILFTENDFAAARIGIMTQADIGDRSPLREDVMQASIDRLASDYKLSPRETEIVNQMVGGRTIARISEALSISPGTVSTHIRHVYQKCGVETRQEFFDILMHMKQEL